MAATGDFTKVKRKRKMSGVDFVALEDGNHHKVMLQHLHDLSDKECLTDVTFHCMDDVKVNAHQKVLGQVSTFLYKMFAICPERSHFVVPDYKGSIIQEMLKMIYLGKTSKVTANELEDVKSVCQALDIDIESKSQSVSQKPQGVGKTVLSEPKSHPNQSKSIKKKRKDPVYCLCKEPERPNMIGCDFCDEWYHPECLNLSEQDISEAFATDKWKCPNCEYQQAKSDRSSKQVDMIKPTDENDDVDVTDDSNDKTTPDNGAGDDPEEDNVMETEHEDPSNEGAETESKENLDEDAPAEAPDIPVEAEPEAEIHRENAQTPADEENQDLIQSLTEAIDQEVGVTQELNNSNERMEVEGQEESERAKVVDENPFNETAQQRVTATLESERIVESSALAEIDRDVELTSMEADQNEISIQTDKDSVDVGQDAVRMNEEISIRIDGKIVDISDNGEDKAEDKSEDKSEDKADDKADEEHSAALEKDDITNQVNETAEDLGKLHHEQREESHEAEEAVSEEPSNVTETSQVVVEQAKEQEEVEAPMETEENPNDQKEGNGEKETVSMEEDIAKDAPTEDDVQDDRESVPTKKKVEIKDIRVVLPDILLMKPTRKGKGKKAPQAKPNVGLPTESSNAEKNSETTSASTETEKDVDERETIDNSTNNKDEIHDETDGIGDQNAIDSRNGIVENDDQSTAVSTEDVTVDNGRLLRRSLNLKLKM